MTAIAAAYEAVDLRAQLRRAQRRRQWQAFALTLPLLLLLITVFILPIGSTLFFATESSEVKTALPNVYEVLQEWDGESLPGEDAFAALAKDIAKGYEDKTTAGVATRLNYEVSGFRAVVMRTARKSSQFAAPYKASLIGVNENWGDIAYWRAIKMASDTLTPRYILQAIELEQNWDKGIVRVPEEQRVFLEYLKRTFAISFWVTAICFVLGYPLAYFAAHARPLTVKLVLVAVLLPFWTSVLVRMAAWMSLLQKEGIINSLLTSVGLVDDPLQLIFNRPGLYIAMVHILLPFMVLPIYSVMQKIPPIRVRAAKSLGATPMRAFLDVYVPDTLPGVSAGCLLVFIISLGYYITPALIGGATDQMLSSLITVFALETGNWGLASAVSLLLLVCTTVIYVAFNRILGAKAFDVD